MSSSNIRTPAIPNLFISEKTRQLSKSRPNRKGGKGLIASTNVEIPSPPASFFLGYSTYPSSWPLCFCVNQNTCPNPNNPGTFGLANQDAGWRCYGYSSTHWIIKGLNIGRHGYLFVYMDSSLCGVNKGSNQGKAQVVTAWSLAQINSFNNPNLLLPGIQSISQFILAYCIQNPQFTPKTLLSQFPNVPGVVDDPTIYYIPPKTLKFTIPKPNTVLIMHYSTLQSAPAPNSALKCIYVSTFFSLQTGIFTDAKYSDLSLTNLSVSNTTTGAILVTSALPEFEPYIYFPENFSAGNFTFNAYQDFYQNYDKQISYLPSQLSLTVNVVNP
jgi:hypothetical protein